MAFKDRFIKVPIELINKKLLEINGNDNNADNQPSFAMINPFEIAYYMPAMDKQDNLTKTIIYFKASSESLWIDMTIKEFEVLMEHFGKR